MAFEKIGNDAQSLKNYDVVKAVFQIVETKNIENFDKLFSPSLKVHKNNEAYDFDRLLQYGKELVGSGKTYKVFPFEMVLANGEYITLKYTIHATSPNQVTRSERFISIFEIKDNLVQNIWELVVPVEKNI